MMTTTSQPKPPRELVEMLTLPRTTKPRTHRIPYGVTDARGNSECPKCHRPVALTGRGGWKHTS